jgi:hypothetical protein
MLRLGRIKIDFRETLQLNQPRVALQLSYKMVPCDFLGEFLKMLCFLSLVKGATSVLFHHPP